MKRQFLTLTILVSLCVTSIVFTFTACNNEENDLTEKSFEKRSKKNTNFVISLNDVDVLVSLRPNGTVSYFKNTKTGVSYVPENREVFGWLFPYDDKGAEMAKDYIKDVDCGAVYEGVNVETDEKYYVALYTNDGGNCDWIYQIEKITL